MDAQNKENKIILTKTEKRRILSIAAQVKLDNIADATTVFRAISNTKESPEWNAAVILYYKKKEKELSQLVHELELQLEEGIKKIT